MPRLCFLLFMLLVLQTLASCDEREQPMQEDQISGLAVPPAGRNSFNADIPSARDRPVPATGTAEIAKTPEATDILHGGEVMEGLFPGQISALAFDRNNVLWLSLAGGTPNFDGIVASYDNKFRIFDRYNTRDFPGRVTRILVDSKNRKWFASQRGEVFTFDDKNWEILPVPEKTTGIAQIQEDNDGMVWVLGRKDERDYNKSQGSLWSYKDGKIDKVYSDGFGRGSPGSLAIDSRNNLWVGTWEGLYRFDGTGWASLKDELPHPNMRALAYENNTQKLYIYAPAGYADTRNGRILSEASIYSYKDGKFEQIVTEETGLPANLRWFYPDGKGNIWVAYGNERNPDVAVARFDGREWTRFDDGAALKGWRVYVIGSNNAGEIWLGGMPPSGTRSPLAKFDGTDWAPATFPMLQQDPRIWWRQKSLLELFQYPVSMADIHDVLADPVSYRGKKIRISGKIKSSFEYASLTDEKGTPLQIWPDGHLELSQFLKDAGIRPGSDTPGNDEYVGFLEFGGFYGHMGAWRYQLFMTEFYPYFEDKQRSDEYRRNYADYVSGMAQDKKAIQAAIDEWIAARKSGDVDRLRKVYHPDSPFYEYLFSERGQEEVKKNTMDIAYGNMSIYVNGSSASARLTGVTVEPPKYYELGTGERIPYEFSRFELKKDGSDWKMTNVFYEPDIRRYLTPPPLPKPKQTPVATSTSSTTTKPTAPMPAR